MTRARDVANIDGLLTTTGDTYYASAAGTPARLGVGTTGQVLTVAAGVPSWATPSSGTFPKLTYVEPGANVTVTSTSLVDVTGYAVTFTPSSATNKVQINLSLSYKTAASANQNLVLYDGATVIRYVTQSSTVANGETFLEMTANLTNVSATAHTIQLKASNAQNTTLTCFGTSAGNFSSISVLEIY